MRHRSLRVRRKTHNLACQSFESAVQNIQKYKSIACALYVLALLVAFSMPTLAFAVLDTGIDTEPPQWVAVLLVSVWYASVFLAAYPLVVLVCCSLFWFLGQNVFKKSRYLSAVILGSSAGLLVCFMIAVLGFGPENQTLIKAYLAAANSVIPYVNGKSHLSEYESYRGLIDHLAARGRWLVMLSRFLDSCGYCILPGVLLPPFALHMWERYSDLKHNNTRNRC
jgi:hypothetical protein